MIILEIMENSNDPEWFDNLRRKLQDFFDLRYTLQEGIQKWVNRIVIASVAIILSSFLAALVAVFTGIIKP